MVVGNGCDLPPDFGLYAAKQVQRGGQPKDDQLPEHGVVEVKSADDDAWQTATSEQVSKYWGRYRLVLVTNYREFLLVGEDANGNPARLESFRLAADAEDFEQQLEKPRAFAERVGVGLGEYLRRVLSHRARLSDPRDLAELLASHARDALARVESAEAEPGASASPLATVRDALEEALGVQFEGERGARFFRSTLVQTLFYGVFSAWVLWARQTPPPTGAFEWRTAVWHLRAPVMRALFQQLSEPGRLQPLGLVDVLDWTAAALNRVVRDEFFASFSQGEAVPYFYEPFLEAFDPELRRELGVWYTPPEVVRYMVARVDRALKDDLGIADGLAAENVYVLDPCCGTGAYLAETLRRVSANLEGQGLGALTGARVKQAATKRVFGLKIMPAPFVVAHLQVGLTMQDLDAPLAEDGEERAGIFLTNALTGWEPHAQRKLPIPELAEERDRAERVKQDTPILVILGNPPYNGFAGVAIDEEQDLLDAYRTATRVELPDTRALHDLYVRFFRMAERRIAERSRHGIVCFISNYSWLDGRSFAGMRERYLEAFDAVRIDCLNGDVRTGGRTPDGAPYPSVFTTDRSVGIQVGTAITTLVRQAAHTATTKIGFRHLWGQAKLAELTSTAEAAPKKLYADLTPVLSLGLPFKPTTISGGWASWPTLPELFPVNFSGVNTNRDAFLVDTDLDRLRARVVDYFDPNLSHSELAELHPSAMRPRARYYPESVRDTLLARGGPTQSGFIRYTYRPFDTRWLYWEADTKLLNEKRPDYRPHVFDENLWLSSAPHLRKFPDEPQACVTQQMACLHMIERGANLFPAWLDENALGAQKSGALRPNLSAATRRYLDRLGFAVEDLFHHVVAVLHDPAYRATNAGALRMEWPRIPLPHWSELSAHTSAEERKLAAKVEHAAETLADSVARGRELVALLEPDSPVPGVTTGQLRPEIAAIVVPATTHGRNMFGEDFRLTAGWGHFGARQAVMPGQGRAVERGLTESERAAVGAAPDTVGETAYDIYLNENAYWRNVPANVWNYRLGGYQVLKKWMSYRERKVLGRALKAEVVGYFSEVARRIGVILLLRLQSDSTLKGLGEAV